MKLSAMLVCVASTVTISMLVVGCGDKPSETTKVTASVVSPADVAKNEYAAEAALMPVQCKQDPREIFSDKKRKRSVESWKKFAAEQCPKFVFNEQTHQLSTYYRNERYIVKLSEHGNKGNETMFVVHDVNLISPVCRKEQKRMQKCVDEGKELIACIDAMAKPAPENCPYTME